MQIKSHQLYLSSIFYYYYIVFIWNRQKCICIYRSIVNSKNSDEKQSAHILLIAADLSHKRNRWWSLCHTRKLRCAAVPTLSQREYSIASKRHGLPQSRIGLDESCSTGETCMPDYSVIQSTTTIGCDVIRLTATTAHCRTMFFHDDILSATTAAWLDVHIVQWFYRTFIVIHVTRFTHRHLLILA